MSEGVILEDDVLPDASFFPYCSELLERYREDGRVGMVSGSTPGKRPPRDGASYRFSRYAHVWGWASWRRAWRCYDAAMAYGAPFISGKDSFYNQSKDAAGVRLGPIDKSLIFAVDDEVVRSDRRDRPPVLAERARPHPPPV